MLDISLLACCSSSWCNCISAAICPAQMCAAPVSLGLTFDTLTLLSLSLSLSLDYSSFSVSHVTPGDMAGVANLLSGLEGAEDIVSDVTQYTVAKRDPNDEGGTPISAVVAKCSNQVVGVAVVRTEQV